ncbi:MAG TPA: DUF4252 domain-containing protein [Candidatus Solibacter sp.]|nr:DUF4252 domain-containing protein [Candidatus Solibacter sp.]
MKLAWFALLAALCAAPLSFAQKLDLKFDALAARASEKVELDLDADLLRLILKMGDEREHHEWLEGVRAVKIRTYTFDTRAMYSDKDLDALRSQVSAQGRWSRVLTHKTDGESTEIWVAADGDKLGACLIVVAEERELAVVYLEGTLTLAQVKGMMEHHDWRGFGQ